MKVNYIYEGLFKTPEQLRAEAEQRDSLSDEELIASTSKEAVEGSVCKFIDYILNDVRYDNIGALTDYRTILEPTIFGHQAAYLFYVSYPHMVIPHDFVTKYKTEVDINNTDKIIFVDIYVKIVNERWLNYCNSFMQKSIACMDYCGQSDLREYYFAQHSSPRNSNRGMPIGENFANNMKIALSSEKLRKRGVLTDTLKDFMSQYTIMLNKIHLFSEVDNDMIFSIPFEMTASGTSHRDNEKMTMWLVDMMANSLTDIFVFENNGRIIFEDKWDCDKQVIVKKKN